MIVSQTLFRAMGEGLAWVVGRRRRVKVTGRSMLPTLDDGEFVLVDESLEALPGQLVVAFHPERPEMLVVKRLVAVDTAGLTLVSDNPEQGTDSRTWGPVSPEKVLGVVTVVLDRPTTGPDLSGF